MKLYTWLVIMFILTTCQICQAVLQGAGIATNPYQISSLTDLEYLSNNYSTIPLNKKYFIQTANIDAQTTSSWNNGQGFKPIGNSASSFQGIYDGKGYDISNLFINRGAEAYCGLFGKTIESTIQNVSLKNVEITGFKYVGAIAGYTMDTKIDNCYSDGSLTTIFSVSHCGGIVGASDGSKITSFTNLSRISNSSSNTILSGTFRTGGITSIITRAGVVSNCAFRGTLKGTGIFGGIVGVVYEGSNSTIEYCYSVANITSSISANCGLLVGVNSTPNITSCFYKTDPDLSAIGTNNTVNDPSNFHCSTETEMKDASNYMTAGWNFATTWCLDDINLNSGYPYLYWQQTNPHSLITVDDEATNTIDAPSVDVSLVFANPLPQDTQLLLTRHESAGTPTNGLANSQEVFGSSFWRIKSTLAEAANYSLKLNLSNNVFPANLEQIKIFKRANADSEWVDVTELGGELTWDGAIVTISGLSAFSDFIPVIEDSSLPVELSSFTVDLLNDNSIKLQWEVQSESNLLGYYILKNHSNCLSTAQVIPSLIEPVNSPHSHSYSFIDHPQFNDDIIFYWLKSVELSNQVDYYGPLQVILDHDSNILVDVKFGNQLSTPYPNPFNPTTTISFSVDKAQLVELKIYNLKGQVVRNLFSGYISQANTKESVVWNGKDDKEHEVSSGTYLIKLKLENEEIYRKVILQK